MTVQEVIRNINALGAVCGQKDFYDKEFAEALYIAIESMERQIPKKPKGISVTHEQRVGNCPCCNKLVGEKTDSIVCTKCLQALKWGEEDD